MWMCGAFSGPPHVELVVWCIDRLVYSWYSLFLLLFIVKGLMFLCVPLYCSDMIFNLVLVSVYIAHIHIKKTTIMLFSMQNERIQKKKLLKRKEIDWLVTFCLDKMKFFLLVTSHRFKKTTKNKFFLRFSAVKSKTSKTHQSCDGIRSSRFFVVISSSWAGLE